MAYEDSMAEALGITIDEVRISGTELATQLPPSEIVNTESEKIYDSEAEKDFNLARKNLTHITTKGQEALDTVVDLAMASEHPRAFEVVSQIISALSAANRDLMGLHAQREALKKPQDKSSGQDTSVINQSIFVGSTKELQELLSKRKLKVI